MKTTALLVSLFTAAALLAGCSKEEAPAPAPASSSTPAAPAAAPTAASGDSAKVSIDTIAQETHGFEVGPTMSARVVYVFFDPQCPHCSALWYAAKPLKSQAKFVWIPVRLLNDTSESQGAAILASKDPAEAMDQHEASMMDRKGGIQPEGKLDAQKAAVKKNTDLFTRYQFSSVPTLITKNAQGAVITHEGALPTPDLAAFIGAPVPEK